MAPSLQGVGTRIDIPGLVARRHSVRWRIQEGARAAESLFRHAATFGAALGTSYLDDALFHRQQVNQSYLVEHITVSSTLRRMNDAGQALSTGQWKSTMGATARHGR